MVLFVIFCVQKKKKKFQNDLNECIFLLILLYVEMKRYRSASERAGTSVPDMMGALLWLAAFCVSFWVCLVFFFSSVVIFTFLLSLLHHNETFSTNIHTDPVVVQ